ncbi:snRNA-activating protein complex, subunit 3, partial [Radiomyces spectabilis]|uniref:snRNA-activating protein complex, subunit 3 n=1 Tax=Radiomyces spectabilis TaxID=64574 RepID=UPI00221E9E9A
TSASMQQTTFEDLKIRLNHPYVYLHQTKCCHLLLIRDIRFVNTPFLKTGDRYITGKEICKNDESDYSAYPRTTYSWRYERHKCTMCTIYPSEYVTMDDYLSGHSPCYWCRHCFFPFHYDKDGKKVG